MIRLPDPYTHPEEAPGFTVSGITDNYNSYVEQLPNGSVVEQRSKQQFWGLSITYPELYFPEYQLIATTLMKCRSQGKDLGLILPHYEEYIVTQDPDTMEIEADQQGNYIEIDKYFDRNLPLVGRFMKFSNSSKVYKILDVTDLNFNKIGLTIYPNIVKPTTIATKPIFNNVIFNCWIESPETFNESFSIDGVFDGFTIGLRENVK